MNSYAEGVKIPAQQNYNGSCNPDLSWQKDCEHGRISERTHGTNNYLHTGGAVKEPAVFRAEALKKCQNCSLRNSVGVIPVFVRKALVKWDALLKPHCSAISSMEAAEPIKRCFACRKR